MTGRARIALAALFALTLAGCGTMGETGSDDASRKMIFGRSKANGAALIGGSLLGTSAAESAPDTEREQLFLKQWQHDRQFF